jgi:ABC-type antimicrobial peptide transport system permease subunit
MVPTRMAVPYVPYVVDNSLYFGDVVFFSGLDVSRTGSFRYVMHTLSFILSVCLLCVCVCVCGRTRGTYLAQGRTRKVKAASLQHFFK